MECCLTDPKPQELDSLLKVPMPLRWGVWGDWVAMGKNVCGFDHRLVLIWWKTQQPIIEMGQPGSKKLWVVELPSDWPSAGHFGAQVDQNGWEHMSAFMKQVCISLEDWLLVADFSSQQSVWHARYALYRARQCGENEYRSIIFYDHIQIISSGSRSWVSDLQRKSFTASKVSTAHATLALTLPYCLYMGVFATDTWHNHTQSLILLQWLGVQWIHVNISAPWSCLYLLCSTRGVKWTLISHFSTLLSTRNGSFFQLGGARIMTKAEVTVLANYITFKKMKDFHQEFQI